MLLLSQSTCKFAIVNSNFWPSSSPSQSFCAERRHKRSYPSLSINWLVHLFRSEISRIPVTNSTILTRIQKNPPKFLFDLKITLVRQSWEISKQASNKKDRFFIWTRISYLSRNNRQIYFFKFHREIDNSNDEPELASDVLAFD